MMHMTFYWGKNVTILFDSWKTATWLSYLLSLLAVFAIAVFYQYLEGFRIKLKLLQITKKPSSSIEDPILRGSKTAKLTAETVSVSILFGISSAIGYMLMLAVMSFNGGVFVAACVGLALGYFAFRCDGEDDAANLESSCACS